MSGRPAGAVAWSAAGPLSTDGQRVFADLLAYCFPGGNWWSLDGVDPPAISYVPATDEHEADVEDRLERAFRRAAVVPGRKPRVLADLWDLPARPAAAPAASRMVGPGLAVAGPELARLMRAIDDYAFEMATSYGAAEFAVPHLASWRTIERAGYAQTFPQHLTTCATVRPDLEALDRFAHAPGPAERAEELLPAAVTLSPAVCLHLFAGLADRPLAGQALATARQACGRHEAGSAQSPTRLWSFTMREIVFVGDARGARRFCADMLDMLGELAAGLGLPCRIASATDPFFTAARQDLVGYQSGLDLKHELCGRIAEDGSSLALSSVNLHHQHFGHAFGIQLEDGETASSACVGFGLERWAQWLYGYLGDNPEAWPGPLRRHALASGPGHARGMNGVAAARQEGAR